MGKSQKNNKIQYMILNGSPDLIKYYRIFECGRHKYQTKEAIMGCLGYFRQKKQSRDASRMIRLKPTV
jgi:hypothetical protein